MNENENKEKYGKIMGCSYMIHLQVESKRRINESRNKIRKDLEIWRTDGCRQLRDGKQVKRIERYKLPFVK